MSKSVSYLCLLVALVAASAYAQPQPAKEPTTAATPLRRDPGAILARIKEITSDLKLTSEQQTKVDAIFAKVHEQVKSAAQTMQDATGQEKMAKFKEILGDLRAQLIAVLDENQKSEFNDKLAALRSTISPAAPTTGPAVMVQKIKDALDRLDLNEDQKAKIQDVFQSVRTQMQDLHSQVQAGTMDRAAGREKMRPILEGARDKIIDQLTSDQAQSLRDMIK